MPESESTRKMLSIPLLKTSIRCDEAISWRYSYTCTYTYTYIYTYTYAYACTYT